MAKQIKSYGITAVWVHLLESLLEKGSMCSPRGQKTTEILNMTLEVEWGRENVILCPVRDLNYRYMVAEWLWILAGLNGVDTLSRYNSKMREFSDDGLILSGAYGPRLMPQMKYIVECLQNHDTRQAVATIWTPSPTISKDIPCTISLQWFIRNSGPLNLPRLNCTVNMRSSDAWLGIPYDFYTFSQITNWLSLLVGVSVGSITMNLGSSHLYERDWEAAYKVLANQGDLSTLASPPFYENEYLIISNDDLRNMLENPDKMSPEGPVPWVQYADALTSTKAHALEVLRELSTK